MVPVLACVDYDSTVDNGDGTFGACLQTQWVDQLGLLPPLPAESGLVVSGMMLTACAIAWGYKAIRRYISPRV